MKKKLPLVSVVMPSYNVQNYIAKAIESILQQSYKHIEFVIINDGSTDDTAKVIQSFVDSDSRIKFINRKENKGIAITRNECLKHCTGSYIACMDSDDISLPHRLQVQMEIMLNNPNIDICGAYMKLFGNDNVIWKNPQNDIDIKSSRILFGKTGINHSTTVFKAKVFQGDKYREVVAEDYDLFGRIMQEGKFCFYNVKKVLYHYRRFDGQVTNVKQNELKRSVINSVTENIKKIYPQISSQNLENYQKIVAQKNIYLVKNKNRIIQFLIDLKNSFEQKYSSNITKNTLFEMWFQICLSQQKYGLKIIWVFITCKLFIWNKKSIVYLLKIMVRCLRNSLRI